MIGVVFYAIRGLTTLLSGAEFELDKLMGLNVSTTLGDLTLRAGYLSSDMTIHSDGLKGAINALRDPAGLCGIDPVACRQGDSLEPDAKSAKQHRLD